MAKMKYFSGFGSCSIVTTYAKELGFECGLLNELDPLRAQWAQETFRHQGLTDAEVVQGDFRDPKIFKALLRKFRKKGLEMALFSPCCQPFSKAGKQHLDSPEAFLFLDIIKFIRKGRPLYSWIENAAEFPTSVLKDDPRTIEQRIRDGLEPYGFDVKWVIQDAADFGTPQHRRRSIFIITRKDAPCVWNFPEKLKEPPKTAFQTIGHLPKVGAGERCLTIPLHNGPYLPQCQIDCIHGVPEGGTAPDPVNVDGTKPKKKKPKYAFARIKKDDVVGTIVQKSASISGYRTLHYEQDRTLTVWECILLSGLDETWYIPLWVRNREQLIRDVLGESFAPLHAREILRMLANALDEKSKDAN